MNQQLSNLTGQLREQFAARIEQGVSLYRAREEREQRVLLAAAIIIPLIILIFAIWLPQADKQKAAKQELAAKQTALAEATVLARKISAGQGSSVGGDLLTKVEQAAVAAGVRSAMQRLNPITQLGGGQGVEVRMQDAPYPGTVQFLHALAQAGVAMESAQIAAADNYGFVHVQLQLR